MTSDARSSEETEQDDLRADLTTMVERWESDTETLEGSGMTRRAGQLSQCIAEVRHFINKHDGDGGGK